MSNCVWKGQHVYNHAVDVGDTYECFPEPNNVQNHKAIVVRNSTNEVIGHVPDNLCDSVTELIDRLPHKLHMFWLYVKCFKGNILVQGQQTNINQRKVNKIIIYSIPCLLFL